MKVLLDTHAFLWWLFDDPKLPAGVREVIADLDNDVYVSSASAWEIATKHRLGKLDAAELLVKDISGWIAKAGFREIPISVAHGQHAGSWRHEHRDPFDRMLAAQSALEDLPLITADKALHSFGITVIWTE